MLEVTNTMQFQKALEDFAKKTRRAPEVMAAQAMLTISRQTILFTRVDTGRLAQAWQISETPQPSFSAVPTGQSGANESEVKNRATSAATSAIGKYQGGVIWFANSAEYATHREYGTASTPGDYMLTRSVQFATDRINEIIKAAQNELS